MVVLAELVRTLKTHELRELGYPSATAYLMHIARMSAGHAKRIVAMANSADKAPVAFRAWVDGRLSSDQAVSLFRAAEALPDSYPSAEETLVQVVEPLSASDTATAVECWRQSEDGPGVLDVETQMQRRGLSLSKSHDGNAPNRRLADSGGRSGLGNLASGIDATALEPKIRERRDNVDMTH